MSAPVVFGIVQVATFNLTGLTADTSYTVVATVAGTAARGQTTFMTLAVVEADPEPSIRTVVAGTPSWNSVAVSVAVDQDGALASTMRIEWRYRLLGSAWQSGGFSGVGAGSVAAGFFSGLLWSSRYQIEARLRYQGSIVDTRSVFIATTAVPQSEITRLIRERDAAQATIDRLTRENVGHGSIVVAGERLLSAIDGISLLGDLDPVGILNAIVAAQGAVDGYNNAIAGTPHPRFTFPNPLTTTATYNRALAAARSQVTETVTAEQRAITTNQATVASQRMIVTDRQELIDRYRSDPTP